MIFCDFCLKAPPEDIVLVEAAIRKAHICEHCVEKAARLIEEQKKK